MEFKNVVPSAARKKIANLALEHISSIKSMQNELEETKKKLESIESENSQFKKTLGGPLHQIKSGDGISPNYFDHIGLDKTLSAIEAIQREVGAIRAALHQMAGENQRFRHECIDRLSDLESLALKSEDETLKLMSAHPVAFASDDHKHPRGTRNDNTRSPRFVKTVEKHFNRKVRHLDLGCAGGGLVLDFVLAGHDSYGVEGSDYSQKEGRAEWRVLPKRLFTGDITKPFKFVDAGGAQRGFDVISAWEVLEHIPESDLVGLCENIKANLVQGGIFVASIATFEDCDPITGAVYHVTVRPKKWWEEFFINQGFGLENGIFGHLDYVRGAGNARVGADDWNAYTNPELGFHLTLINK